MSMLLMAQVMKSKVGSSTRKLVLLKLADNANDEGYCWPSYQHVSDQCEISKRSAMRHIAELEKLGFLKRIYRKGSDGQNRSNAYQLIAERRSPDSLTRHRPVLDDTTHNHRGDKMTLGDGDTVSLGGDTESPGSDRVSPGGSDTVSPRTSHSLEPIKEPVTKQCAEEPIEAFERYWGAGMRKIDKIKARQAFDRKCKLLKLAPGELADRLVPDVKQRLKAKVFGFSSLHPTTYLNNERWNDEVPLTDEQGRYIGSAEDEEFTENEDGSFAL